LEDEVRQLKEMVRQLSSRVEELSTRTTAGAASSAASGLDGSSGVGASAGAPGTPSARGGTYGPQEASAAGGGSAAARGPLDPRRTTRFNMPGISPNLPVEAIFGPGFQLQTTDDEFQFQFHDLTQVDGRYYLQGGQVPVASTFLLPREWMIFSGRLTRPFEY
jgi:phosphate-selective porin OprO/OprP